VQRSPPDEFYRLQNIVATHWHDLVSWLRTSLRENHESVRTAPAAARGEHAKLLRPEHFRELLRRRCVSTPHDLTNRQVSADPICGAVSPAARMQAVKLSLQSRTLKPVGLPGR
jgi:hypothetical protein